MRTTTLQRYRPSYIEGLHLCRALTGAAAAFLVLGFLLTSLEPRGLTANEGGRKFMIAATGDTAGNLEICGCPKSPAGGLARRAWILNRYREAGREVLAVEAGGFWSGWDPLDAERTLLYLQALEAMGWGPVLLGKPEFEHQRESLEELASGTSLTLLATNVDDAEGRPVPWKRDWTGDVAGLRVGVLGITGGATPEFMREQDLRMRDPLQALSEEVPRLRTKVDLLIILTDVGPERGSEICTSVPGIDLLVNRGSDLIYQKAGPSIQVFGSREGKHLRLVTVRPGKEGDRVRFQVSEKLLDSEVPEDPAIRDIIDQWYAGIAARPEYAWTGENPTGGLGNSNATYTGAETCEPCHQKNYATWKLQRHQVAMIALLREQRHFVPHCQACHVTGYGAEGGFAGGRPDHPMAGVQCEACHGPGSIHASDPEQEPPIGLPTRETCEMCHDTENSPEFDADFEYYWAVGKHRR